MSDCLDLNPARMRQALGRYATGVTVVTAAGAQGPIGMTVNSFASVSLDPPLVLWSLRRASLLHAEFIARPAFAVHVLGASHRHLARAFAQTAEDRYAGLDWYPGHDGLPVFDDCVALRMRHPPGAGRRRSRHPDRPGPAPAPVRRRGRRAGVLQRRVLDARRHARLNPYPPQGPAHPENKAPTPKEIAYEPTLHPERRP